MAINGLTDQEAQDIIDRAQFEADSDFVLCRDAYTCRGEFEAWVYDMPGVFEGNGDAALALARSAYKQAISAARGA